jgi:hypothetical protein
VLVDTNQPIHQLVPPELLSYNHGNYSSFLTQMNRQGYYIVKNIMNFEQIPNGWVPTSLKWKNVFGGKRCQCTHLNSVVDNSAIKPLLDESKAKLDFFY